MHILYGDSCLFHDWPLRSLQWWRSAAWTVNESSRPSDFTRMSDGRPDWRSIASPARHYGARRAAGRGVSPRRLPPSEVADGGKWCPDCAQIKPADDFPRTRANSVTGLHTYCKPGHNVRGKLSKEKVGGSRTYHLKRRYGIIAADADARHAEQDGLCALCRMAPAAQVDHDHATGKVRGLLCFNCNGGLGQFNDRIDVLEAAVDYLNAHNYAANAPSQATSPPSQYRWPGVIELFPHHGRSIEVEPWRHTVSA